MIVFAEMSKRAKNTELGLRKEVKAKERGLILPVESLFVKAMGKDELVQEGGQKRKSKDRALGRVAR